MPTCSRPTSTGERAVGDQRASRPTSAPRTLLKTAAGTQKAFDDAEAALRTAQARLNSAQTRLDAPQAAQPGRPASVQQIYYRPGEMVPAGRPVVSLLPPGNIKVRFFVPQAMLPSVALGDAVDGQLRRLRQADVAAQGQLHRAQRRNSRRR